MRARVLGSFLTSLVALLGATAAHAGALTIVGVVTSCQPTWGDTCWYPVGTPTVTRVVFDHQRVPPVGRYWSPVAALHSTILFDIGGDTWTEKDDFEYWETRPHGAYFPRVGFEDGRLAGFVLWTPGELRVFHFEFSTGDGASGTLALEVPPYLPEPGSLWLMAGGLVALSTIRPCRRAAGRLDDTAVRHRC
jgi:hypothetical protein